MYNQRPWQQVMNLLFPNSQQQQWPAGGSHWPGPGGQQGGFAPAPPPGSPPAPPPGPPPGTTLPGGPPSGPSAPPPIGAGVYAVDPGAMQHCLHRYTYVTLESGRRFWFWPTFIGRTSVAGYRWRPRQYRWDYAGFDTRQIASFHCS
ncbi:hypothetical protein SAMN05421736_10748 [Evansella caseinilytica]|uniref:Transporter n=1 Tax=Evansella caseinilytica TaxID=1503961 RepID=A0A1H3QTQ0_9BACI|nr:hypothetical protein [Evansella caseinilytica]SDZ16807.1 hypothetical protein SAMN05421736_10748 [Evansella caseinilytica]